MKQIDTNPTSPTTPPISTDEIGTTDTVARLQGTTGQATTEYALILLGAAVVGLIVVAWATSGGASGRIGQLFNAVVDSVISRL